MKIILSIILAILTPIIAISFGLFMGTVFTMFFWGLSITTIFGIPELSWIQALSLFMLVQTLTHKPPRKNSE